MPTCQHCSASRAHLHHYQDRAGLHGTFDVVRCLACGWQASRLLPWRRKAQPFPVDHKENPAGIESLEDRGEREYEERLAKMQKMAFSSFKTGNLYQGTRF